MARLDLSEAKPLAIYEVSTLFNAVGRYKNALSVEAQAINTEGNDRAWMKHHPPFATIRSLDKVLEQLQEWQIAGITHVMSNAPLSDDNITGPFMDSLMQQIRDNRFTPVPPAAKDALKL